MRTYKFNYVVTSERVGYIYANDKKEAIDKLESILNDEGSAGLEEIEDNYVETICESDLGIDFESLKLVKDVDEGEENG